MGSIYTLDLHTHSTASPDGSLTLTDYKKALESGLLNYIAVTDHNSVEFARQVRAELGDHIIVGEEISTRGGGEIIGLFLRELVPPGLSPQQTVQLIHQQEGLVYVPHPFETVRHGLRAPVLDTLVNEIDVMEVFNGRAWLQNKSSAAKRWAAAHDLAVAASSDAHGRRGWGKTRTVVDEVPTAGNLSTVLRRAKLIEQTVGFRGVLYPKLNRLRQRGAA